MYNIRIPIELTHEQISGLLYAINLLVVTQKSRFIKDNVKDDNIVNTYPIICRLVDGLSKSEYLSTRMNQLRQTTTGE